MELKDPNGKVIATVSAADVNASGCDEGVWVEVCADDGTKPTICLVKGRPGDAIDGWYVGFYRDAKKPGVGCDFAVSMTGEGPVLQVAKGGDVKIVNLFDLLSKVA